jgi:hypothetical protein
MDSVHDAVLPCKDKSSPITAEWFDTIVTPTPASWRQIWSPGFKHTHHSHQYGRLLVPVACAFPLSHAHNTERVGWESPSERILTMNFGVLGTCPLANSFRKPLIGID